MTRGLVRYQQAGDLHFITFSCYDRRPYLGTETARDLFEESLESMRLRYGFFLTGYVVMPEHVHLLISEPKGALLAKVLQALKLSVAVRREERPFWQVRYYDFNVFTEKKRIEKLRYMHRNPVKRGLVEKPYEWRWSSFRHYLTGEVGVVEIESEWTATRRERGVVAGVE
ncbi:MAG TPA: transposase [Verrucomicrobiae bacterium]|nr:transposase [Verrucomicrobiae bacterium]HVW77459.1 transposase [Alloacidobacterium sp.]